MKRIIHAVLGLVFLAALVGAQDADTDPIVNRDPLVSAPPAVAAGGDTNSRLKFAPLPSNSIPFEETKARAEKGDAKAQFDLATRYAQGQGVAQDYVEAVEWFRKAAGQGDLAAQTALGDAYFSGKGVPTNFVEAAKWYQKAPEQGDARVQAILGFMYEVGRGVEKDMAKSVIWFRKAAEQGDQAAQCHLGDISFFGQGVPKDYAEGVKWYRKAAEQGDAEAQLQLGTAFLVGQGVATNLVEGVKWCRKAAEQGLAEAENKLGIALEEGWGIPKDYAEAAHWYQKAAEHGDQAAQNNLGVCYRDGTGVTQDYAQAVKWYRNAAEQGFASAQCNLGVCYMNGQGVPKNDIEAYKWLSLAAAQSSTNSVIWRDSIAESMSREEIVEAQRRAAAFVVRKEGTASDQADGQDPSVVGNVPRFTGTGFFVTDDGYLLTAFHVVADAARIAVRTTAGTFAATLVKADKANDVALLKVAGHFSALPVGLSRAMKLGESVFTIGFPNIELQGFAPKLTKGEISSLTGMQDDPREFQISAAVQPGNSGGPLVNQYGNVVGIVEARLADVSTLETTGALPQNVNYAMKSTVLDVLLESLPEISAKLPEPNPIKDRKFEDVEKEAESAVALVLIY